MCDGDESQLSFLPRRHGLVIPDRMRVISCLMSLFMKASHLPPATGPETDPAHETPIRTPRQLIAWILAGFLVPIITITLIVSFVSSGTIKQGTGSAALTPKVVAQRIAPVGHVEMRDPNAVKVLQTGQQVYQAVCATCHAAGLAGAPKIGSAEAWSARLKQGYEQLVTHAIQGIRGMPAKGGNPDLDDQEVANAVRYMANQSGANFPEPPAGAAQKPATADAPSAAAPDATAAAPASAASAAPATAASTAAPAAAPSNSTTTGSSATVVAAATPAATGNMPIPVSPRPTSAKAASDSGAESAAQNAVGRKIYESACIACHGTGAAGAPKFGDRAAWAPRIALGIDALTQSVIHGKNAMPPRGLAANATDAELRAAVQYLTSAAK